MQDQLPPKVFVSHASEDKERFVLGFAAKLREHGVNAWLDKWEMYPGDSLVDKVFEEGLKEAQAVIVVLSKFSVVKPWVREELNLAVVKRINLGSRLIPVIIEDCDVPEALKSTLWERIADMGNYNAELSRIVNAIYGHTDKPILGAPPAYTQSPVFVIPGLSRIDSLVITCVAENYIHTQRMFMDLDTLFNKVGTYDVQIEDLNESLSVLQHRRLIGLNRPSRVSEAAKWSAFRGYSALHIENYGFSVYIHAFIPDYSQITYKVALELVNNHHWHLDTIAKAVGCERMIVNHVLLQFLDQGLINSARTLTGECATIISVSPELRRRLGEA